MKHADLDDAVNAALERIGAMLDTSPGDEKVGLVEDPAAVLASLDVNPDEVLALAARVTNSYLVYVDVGAAPAVSVRGAFLTGYLIGRLHEPEAFEAFET